MPFLKLSFVYFCTHTCSDLNLQDLDETSSSKKLDRKKRDVLSEPQRDGNPSAGEAAFNYKVERQDEKVSDTRSPALASLYMLDDAIGSQYGTVHRSARQLRGQTGNQPWPSQYEVVDTPFSPSNVYYNTNKQVSYQNRPSQNVPYIQYAEKSPQSSSKAKKHQSSDILPLLLNTYNIQKQNQRQQQYLDDEESNLPDNFSYFHLGKGNKEHSGSEKKQSQLDYNYVQNTTPKGSYVAFSTVGGFYNNQPATQSPSNKYLKQQYFTPSDGRFFANSNLKPHSGGSNGNYQSTQKPYAAQNDESFYSYQNIPHLDQTIQIGNKQKPHKLSQHQQPNHHPTSEKITPSYNDNIFSNLYQKNVNGINQQMTIYNNFQSPYIEEVEIRPKKPHYESSTPKGPNGFYVTEKPRNVEIITKDREKPVYEVPESEFTRKPASNPYNGFEEFVAGIRNTNFKDIQPTYMRNHTQSKPQQQTPQKPGSEYYNDDEYYYDDDYDDLPINSTPQPPPIRPGLGQSTIPLKPHLNSYNNDNNQYYYNTDYKSQQKPNLPQDPLNNHFKIPIQSPNHPLVTHTTSKPTTKARPKPLTTSTTTMKYVSTTPYTPNSDEYYYDDEDYDYKIPANVSKYMPMSETMAPRPTLPSNVRLPQSQYNKYNVHTSNYHYKPQMNQSGSNQGNHANRGREGSTPVSTLKYTIDTFDNVDENGTPNDDDEYEIDIRILNDTNNKNQIPSKSVPSIIQFPDDYFQVINLRNSTHPNNKNRIKTTEIYTNPTLSNQPPSSYNTHLPPTMSSTTVSNVKYTKPSTAGGTASTVPMKQSQSRPTTLITTTPTTTQTIVTTPRKVYTVRPTRPNRHDLTRGNQKWKPSKKNKNKTEQLELDEKLPNR